MALDRQALQRPQRLFHAAAMSPQRRSSARPRCLTGDFAPWNTSPFERLDGGTSMRSIINHDITRFVRFRSVCSL